MLVGHVVLLAAAVAAAAYWLGYGLDDASLKVLTGARNFSLYQKVPDGLGGPHSLPFGGHHASFAGR